jgi:hypothetical protein
MARPPPEEYVVEIERLELLIRLSGQRMYIDFTPMTYPRNWNVCWPSPRPWRLRRFPNDYKNDESVHTCFSTFGNLKKSILRRLEIEAE